MQTKTTLRNYFATTRMAKIKKTGKDMKQLESYTLLMEL